MYGIGRRCRRSRALLPRPLALASVASAPSAPIGLHSSSITVLTSTFLQRITILSIMSFFTRLLLFEMLASPHLVLEQHDVTTAEIPTAEPQGHRHPTVGPDVGRQVMPAIAMAVHLFTANAC